MYFLVLFIIAFWHTNNCTPTAKPKKVVCRNITMTTWPLYWKRLEFYCCLLCAKGSNNTCPAKIIVSIFIIAAFWRDKAFYKIFMDV